MPFFFRLELHVQQTKIVEGENMKSKGKDGFRRMCDRRIETALFLSIRNLHKLRHARHPPTRQRKQIPITRQRNPRIPRHRHREARPTPRRRQRNASLVRVHRMRRARQPDQGEARDRRATRRDRQCSANLHTSCTDAIDDRPGCQRTGAGEQVRRAIDLGIEVVRRAGAAKPSAAVDNGGVWEEHSGGVVVAGNGDGRHLGEFLGGGVEHFGD